MSSVIYYFGTIYIPLLLSLGVHEFAHAYAANKLGDDTSKYMGRMSLNPFTHVDIIGTVILPLCGVPFGWAKPVPINPQKFKRNISMNLGVAIVAFAGPISNLIIAALSWFILLFFTEAELPLLITFKELFEKLLTINIVLAVFNMIPIPPLDGGHIMNYLMPNALRPIWDPIYASGRYLLLAAFFFLSWYVRFVFNYFS